MSTDLTGATSRSPAQRARIEAARIEAARIDVCLAADTLRKSRMTTRMTSAWLELNAALDRLGEAMR